MTALWAILDQVVDGYAPVALGATDEIGASSADPVTAVRDLLPDGVDYAFGAIGLTSTTEQAIRMLALGGAAVLVGLPPAGATASFRPLLLAEADQRILGSNYGSVRPAVDIPALVDRFMDGDLRLHELISAWAPLESAAAALDDLAAGRALRTLLQASSVQRADPMSPRRRPAEA
ncbi:MAG TPA: zinc-binding dehydrogenase [Streptosporangiaceae bacterium]|nr:zinc-binding dehydrogenase [Streptosporangiaceae bacterium]